MGLSLLRHEHIYQAIKEEHEDHGYPISALCHLGKVSRAAYYKWLHRGIPAYEAENKRIAEEIEKIHIESPDKGYRRIRDDLERYHGIKANDKRVLRICRKRDIKSTIKYSNNGCTRQAANPQFIAENILNRDFTADAPNQKWLTDVTEFKYYTGIEVHKVYLSAILDLYDRTLSGIPTIIRWCLKPLIKPSLPILEKHHYAIQTGDFSTRTGYFTLSLRRLE